MTGQFTNVQDQLQPLLGPCDASGYLRRPLEINNRPLHQAQKGHRSSCVVYQPPSRFYAMDCMPKSLASPNSSIQPGVVRRSAFLSPFSFLILNFKSYGSSGTEIAQYLLSKGAQNVSFSQYVCLSPPIIASFASLLSLSDSS